MLCGLFGFVLSGISVVRDVNVQMPQPEARVYERPVVQKLCVLKCKKGRRYARRSSYPFASDDDCSPQSRQEIMISKKQSDPICAAQAWFAYTIRMKHWQGDEPYSFSPSVRLFDATRTGGFLSVPVHPGAFGLEWLDWDEIEVR